MKKILIVLILLIPLNVKAITKAPVDITKMSIEDLANALDKGYLSSEELVNLYLERIEAYNDEFNAIRQINENALEEAKALDIERQNGNVRSKLHGIPIVVKTNIDVVGLATTAGAKSLSDNYPNEDAYAITKLKEAGAIILASTNMSEFAFLARDSNSSYGQVKNAFNTNYTPYGSSGGSAVAVALSFAAASLGTDTNSSVRVPASAAGLVGLRPTLGLVSRAGVIPYDTQRDTIGVLAKTVDDNALILSVIAGVDENDSKTSEALIKDYFGEEDEKIKIGVITSYLEGSVNSTSVNSKTDEDITNLAKEKIELLKAAGIEVVYIDTLIDNYYLTLARSTMSGDSFCDGFNNYIKNTTGTIRSFKDLTYASGHIYSLTGYLSGCNSAWLYDATSVASKKSIFENHILDVMEANDIDIIVYPTTKNKALTFNESSKLISPGSMLGSVIGYPSITIPMGYIEEFPYGLEFLSAKYEEDKLYNIARIFEKLVGLEITNSALTPNLYEIPEYVTNLKEKYELYYEDSRFEKINLKTKKLWQKYSSLEEEQIEEEAIELLNEYEEIIQKNNQNHCIYIVIIIVLSGSLLLIFQKLISKIKKLKKKISKICKMTKKE